MTELLERDTKFFTVGPTDAGLGIDSVRPNIKGDYVPLCAINLFLDPNIPFEIMGEKNEELYAKVMAVQDGCLRISASIYKFISKCIDKEKYHLLFLIREADLEGSLLTLRANMKLRYDEQLKPDRIGFMPYRIRSFTDVASNITRMLPTAKVFERAGFVNAWRSHGTVVSNLLFCFSTDKSDHSYAVCVRTDQIRVIKAMVLAGEKLSSDDLVVFSSLISINKELDIYTDSRGLKKEVSSAKVRQLFEDKRLPSFDTPEVTEAWRKGYVEEFVNTERQRLGFPVPKPKFIAEDNEVLGTSESTESPSKAETVQLPW